MCNCNDDINQSEVPSGPAGPTGATGAAGAAGANGLNGINAYALTSGVATALGSDMYLVPTANITFTNLWITPGQIIYIESCGYFQVLSTTAAVNTTVLNLLYPSNNVAPMLSTSTLRISPAGERGAVGVTPVISGTSTTSLSVTSGTKTLTTQAGIAWVVGQRLRLINPGLTRIMDGEVMSYSGTTLQISINYFVGSGTDTSWNISLVGPQGPAGATGATGPAGSLPSFMEEYSSTSIGASTDIPLVTVSDPSVSYTEMVLTSSIHLSSDAALEATISLVINNIVVSSGVVKQTGAVAISGKSEMTIPLTGIFPIADSDIVEIRIVLDDYTQNTTAVLNAVFTYQA